MRSAGHPLGDKVQIDDATRRRGGLFFAGSEPAQQPDLGHHGGRISAKRILTCAYCSSGTFSASPGRKALFEKLQALIQAHRIDFCIANVENAAGGFGITPQIADEFLEADIDVLTSGNHVWDKRAILPYLSQQPRLLRPHNYPPAAPGTRACSSATAAAACASR